MKGKKFILAGTLLAASAMTTNMALANAKVCFEAESAGAIQSPLKKVLEGSSKEYSGKGFIDIPWDQNKTKGMGSATIKFNVKKAGVYYVWARTFWANGCGNSIAVSINGSGDKILGEDGTYDKWHWVGGAARVQLKAGANTLVLKNRETGVRVDQFFFCEDAGYTPTGIRKVNS